MAEVLYRTRVHERRLERRGSLQTVEMATNGGLVCTALDRTFRGGGSNGSKSTHSPPPSARLAGSEGWRVESGTGANRQHIVASIALPPRLARCPKVRVGRPLVGACREHKYHNNFGSQAFLQQFFAPFS